MESQIDSIQNREIGIQKEATSAKPGDSAVASKRGWKLALRAVGTIVAVGSLVWYCYALFSHLEVLKEIQFNIKTVGAMALGVGLYPVIYGLAAVIWVYALKCLRIELPIRSAMRIGFVAQFGKYMPGNVAHHVARVVLAKHHGASPFHVVFSIVIESVCMVLCGFFVALIALTTQPQLRADFYDRLASGKWQIVIVAAAVVALIVLAILFTRRNKFPQVAAIKFRWLWQCVVLTLIVFILHGLIAQAVLIGVFNVDNSNLIAVTGVFALAWVIGFITPGAPAGIGVREAVLTLGLSSICTPGVALGLAAMLRVVSAFGDGLTFVIGLLIPKGIAANVPNAQDANQAVRNDVNES